MKLHTGDVVVFTARERAQQAQREIAEALQAAPDRLDAPTKRDHDERLAATRRLQGLASSLHLALQLRMNCTPIEPLAAEDQILRTILRQLEHEHEAIPSTTMDRAARDRRLDLAKGIRQGQRGGWKDEGMATALYDGLKALGIADPWNGMRPLAIVAAQLATARAQIAEADRRLDQRVAEWQRERTTVAA